MLNRVIAALFILFFFSGCSKLNLDLDANNAPPPPPPPPETAAPFTDIPIPLDFSRDNSKSFLYESGSGAVKVGRFVYSGWKNFDTVLTFSQNVMLNRGWTLINSIKHEDHILNNEKEGWVSTIILNSKLGKTFIEIQAGPK